MHSDKNPGRAGQRRVDLLVLAFTLFVASCLIGMLTNTLSLAMLPVPVLLALMMLIGALDLEDRWASRKGVAAIIAFNLVSIALWTVSWLTFQGTATTVAGLPLSSGLLMLIVWPLYIFGGGLLFAYWVHTSKGNELVESLSDGDS